MRVAVGHGEGLARFDRGQSSLEKAHQTVGYVHMDERRGRKENLRGGHLYLYDG